VTEETVVALGRDALMTVLLVGAPMLGLGLLAGLVISVFQATTQIYEQTLIFVPKIVAVLVAIVLFGPWMIRTMVAFTTTVLTSVPNMVR
jgi:flagellar biosynthetic protein FliQ